MEVFLCDSALQSHPFPGENRVKLSSLPNVLADHSITEVFIATPASTHYFLAKEALLFGKHVFVEKPFTLSSREARELSALAQTKNLTLMVGHIMEFHPASQKLKELIDGGELGEVSYLRAIRTNFGTLRTDAGVLWDLAVHDIDLICFLLGQRPISVNAWNNAVLPNSMGDIVNLQLNFPNGAVAHILASWLDPLKKRELIVIGQKKMAVFDDTSPSQKLCVMDHHVEYFPDGNAPVGLKCPYQYFHGEIFFPTLDWQEPLRNEVLHFLQAVKAYAEPLTSGKKAVSVIRIMEAAELSIRQGGANVPIDYSS